MKCPKCNVILLLTERQGVEIDYCPECRGVWLDRGELDKVIEKASAQAQPASAQAMPQVGHPQQNSTPYVQQPMPSGFGGNCSHAPHQERHHGDKHGHHQYGYGHSHKHKKKSILGELFDF